MTGSLSDPDDHRDFNLTCYPSRFGGLTPRRQRTQSLISFSFVSLLRLQRKSLKVLEWRERKKKL